MRDYSNAYIVVKGTKTVADNYANNAYNVVEGTKTIAGNYANNRVNKKQILQSNAPFTLCISKTINTFIWKRYEENIGYY